MGQSYDDSVSDTEMSWGKSHWRSIVPNDVPVVFGPTLTFIETGKLLYSEIRNIDEEENLLDDIPPQPIYTERSDDDSRSWGDEYEDIYEEEEDDLELHGGDVDSYVST